MYIPSPMENFNKNNPFIIIAKRTYDTITDEIQSFTKHVISLLTYNGIAFLLNIIFTVIAIFLQKTYGYNMNFLFCLLIVVKICLMIIIISVIRSFFRSIKYFLTDNTAMIEFTRLSSLQVNDILALNNEDILKCTNQLYILYGELLSSKKCYISILKGCLSFQCAFLVGGITYIILSSW